MADNSDKFDKDKRRWLYWLYQAKKRYGLIILDYIVTSNHIHLLIEGNDERNIIPRSMQLIAGRTGQEFNKRKNRKGSFWEDCYHATAIENSEHFLQCLLYIDLNMVRTNVIVDPMDWPFSGYKEIQNPKRKNIIISYEKLKQLLRFDSYEKMKAYLKKCADTLIANKKIRICFLIEKV